MDARSVGRPDDIIVALPELFRKIVPLEEFLGFGQGQGTITPRDEGRGLLPRPFAQDARYGLGGDDDVRRSSPLAAR